MPEVDDQERQILHKRMHTVPAREKRSLLYQMASA